MQFAAAEDDELVRICRGFDAQCDIVDGLAVEAFADLAAGDELAFAAQEGRGVHLEGHADGRFIDGQAGQRLDGGRIAQRVRDLGFRNTGEGHDIAGAGGFHLDPRQPMEAQNLRDLFGALLAFARYHGHGHAALDGAALDAADADRPDIARVVEQRHLQLQRTVDIDVRRRAMFHDGFEQGLHVALAHRRFQSREAAQCRGINDGEIQLFVGCAQTIEQVEGLIQHPARPRFVAVDLVDDHDRPQPMFEGLLRYKTRLRHGAIDRIDEQQHTVDHGEHALDLAAEIGVPRRIDDVDAIVAPGDRGILGENRDAALALQIV